jgi:hypothetical protein
VEDCKELAQQSHWSQFPVGARMRANQAQIVATFRFSATFTAHHYFFQFRICASLRKLGTPLRRHPEVFIFITPFAFPLHSTSFSLFLVSFYFPLFVFLIVLLFSFCSLRFLCLRLLIFMYITLFHSKLQSDIVSPSLRTSLCFPSPSPYLPSSSSFRGVVWSWWQGLAAHIPLERGGAGVGHPRF